MRETLLTVFAWLLPDPAARVAFFAARAEDALGSDDADDDGDGLSGMRELGSVTTNSLPWLEFEACTNLTAGCGSPGRLLVTWTLPEPIYLHGVCVTEVTVDSNGLVYFTRRGGSRIEWSQGNESMMTGSRTLNADSFTVAPFWDSLFLTTVEPASAVLDVDVEVDGVGENAEET